MKTKLQFTLSKLGIAWMFALVTVNFNRVTIYELGISALLIGVMIGLYPFFGPFQPMFRRLTDRYPILGYRRSPYLVIGMVAGSLVFPFLPTTAEAMATGSALAVVAGFVLFFAFGAMIALMANTYLDLIAECTREDERGSVFAAAWTGQTAIIVVWALVFRLFMPDYSAAQMQTLYTLTPFVVAALAVASVWKLERRLSPEEIARLRTATVDPIANTMNSIRSSLLLTRTNPTARMFFVFIVFTFLGIFTQDLVQEVWAGDVFRLNVGESTIFQQIFNGMVTVGMGMTAALGARALRAKEVRTDALPMDAKKRIAAFGGAAATLGFVLLAASSLVAHMALANLAFAVVGFAVGVFTFAAVTMMSDMTVEGQTASYLGLWSIAQALGLGASFIVGGALRAAIVEIGLLPAPAGYAVIFLVEALFMAGCVLMLRGVGVEGLRRDAHRFAPTTSAVAA
ncbi:MAG: BCD family MFS transporter [Anaerolineae bacterium]|nr:BCD family MFS transporter [Anaerolineae bacterium]